MVDIDKNFVYLSQIIDLPVIDVKNRRIGYVEDVAAGIKRMYPRVSALIVRKRFRKERFYISWGNIKRLEDGKRVLIKVMPEVLENQVAAENEILLKESFWDNQIVDTAGSKVVRVNDLHLMKENENLWLVHIDVGFNGFLRRLGWFKYFNKMIEWLFGLTLTDKFIPWKNIQPITTTNVYGSISLKMPYSKLSGLHPADLADILADLGTDERLVIFKSLDKPTAAHALQELPLKVRVHTAELLDSDSLKKIIEEMPMDEVVDLFKELSEETITDMFKVLPADMVNEIRELLEHSERSAGSLMNTEFLSVKHDSTVAEALAKIKNDCEKLESIYYIYAVDERDSLAGVTTLRDLLVSEKDRKISDIMHKNVIKVGVTTNVKKVARVFFKYDFVVVPVVDSLNKLEGIITIKDALEAVFPEMSEESD